MVAEKRFVVYLIVSWVGRKKQTNNTHTRNAYASRWGFQDNITLKNFCTDNINSYISRVKAGQQIGANNLYV